MQAWITSLVAKWEKQEFSQRQDACENGPFPTRYIRGALLLAFLISDLLGETRAAVQEDQDLRIDTIDFVSERI